MADERAMVVRWWGRRGRAASGARAEEEGATVVGTGMSAGMVE